MKKWQCFHFRDLRFYPKNAPWQVPLNTSFLILLRSWRIDLLYVIVTPVNWKYLQRKHPPSFARRHPSCKFQIHAINFWIVPLKKMVNFPNFCKTWFKAGILPPKNLGVFCFNEIPLEMMRIAFYFNLKPLFVFKILKFLFWLFWSCRKTTWYESQG